MINNLYNIGLTSLQNSQASINNASNNIANADTVGYQRTDVSYQTSESITINGLVVGTGADVADIMSSLNSYIEAQYLNASADLATQNAAYEYLYQLDNLLNQSESGLNDTLSDFLAAWNELSTDPDSLSAREALLGEAETLIYGLSSTADQLNNTADAIESEIQDGITEANQLIVDIAQANATIAANPDDLQAISDRDQMIRELNDTIGVDALYQSNGQVTILTEEGYTLVDGTETHSLVYGDPQATQSLMKDSDYDGSIQFSGSSSEEILIEFVSTGTDGTAQFKVSTDGGKTWLEDDGGNTLLYTADDENNAVEIEGVKIWFDGGTTEHMEGDRYTIMPKSGLYWESGSGSLTNITPMTDESGNSVSGATSSGSLAGLFTTRDDTVIPTLDSLNDLGEAIIWEVNAAHAQGAGLEHHTGLTGSYGAEDATVPLSESGLNFAENIVAGDISLVAYDANEDVYSTTNISIDPATDSLADIAASIDAIDGLSASVNSDNKLEISADADMSFEIGGDSANLFAALGMNTYFSGTDASSISVDSYIANSSSYINTGVVGTDGLVATASNDTANAIYALSSTTVSIGNTETTLSGALSSLVSNVGAAANSTELKQTYAQTSAQYLYDQQQSASGVNIDEELLELTKHQQAYQAAAEIITVTRSMMDTILDMV